MTVAYWFRNGSNFDSVCAQVVGGATADGVPSAYRVTSGGAFMSDRYLDVDYGPSAFNVFGESGFKSSAGLDIANFIAAVDRHAVPANIPNYSAGAAPGETASAVMRFQPDGDIETRNQNGAVNTVDRWGASSITGSNFEVRFVQISGDSVSNADSVWRSLNSLRDCFISTTSGTQSGTVRADWRKSGSGSSYFSSQFTLTAEIAI